jgi:carbonic anhydrase/acetyltransferase-like protein (isoleucine patch superfamily)
VRFSRTILILSATLLPSRLAKLIFRRVLGYVVGENVRIGFAYVDCAELTIENGTRISHGVFFTKCGSVRIGKHVRIGPLNLFRGGRSITLEDYTTIQRLNHFNALISLPCTNDHISSLHLGYASLVTNQHLIDFTDTVRIGRHTVIGGRHSSIWTHSRRIAKPVRIGDYCYIGSRVEIAPGAALPHCCIVGLGSVVKHQTTESYSLMSGVPATRIRSLRNEDYKLIFDKTRADLPEEAYPYPSST